MYGLPDRTNDDVDAIIEDIKTGKIPGCVMLDYEKLGELVPRLAMEMAPLREGILQSPLTKKWQALSPSV